MVSFDKLLSGSGNNPPNKTRTNTEKTPNKTKR
jgi:RHS repeat-associated protein